MKPGEGATHRDCAVRDLLNAVQSMMLVHGSSARIRQVRRPRRLALLDEGGRPFAQDLCASELNPVFDRDDTSVSRCRARHHRREER
jgi:hypothetical protein